MSQCLWAWSHCICNNRTKTQDYPGTLFVAINIFLGDFYKYAMSSKVMTHLYYIAKIIYSEEIGTFRPKHTFIIDKLLINFLSRRMTFWYTQVYVCNTILWYWHLDRPRDGTMKTVQSAESQDTIKEDVLIFNEKLQRLRHVITGGRRTNHWCIPYIKYSWTLKAFTSDLIQTL